MGADPGDDGRDVLGPELVPRGHGRAAAAVGEGAGQEGIVGRGEELGAHERRPDAALAAERVARGAVAAEERRADAEQLREELAREGIDVSELADAIARLRELDDSRVYEDMDEIERLQDAVLLGLKDFEFSLRRQVVGPEADRLFLSGSEEVPEEYRELVEQYYRSLSEDDGSSDDGGG